MLLSAVHCVTAGSSMQQHLAAVPAQRNVSSQPQAEQHDPLLLQMTALFHASSAPIHAHIITRIQSSAVSGSIKHQNLIQTRTP
jgi:hypothetical protein